MTDSRPDRGGFGELERADDRATVRFVRRLPHARRDVWRAITEPEHLRAWFPSTIGGERRVGARLHFEFPNGEAEPFEGEMLAYEPPALLSFLWGDETLRFELEPDGDATILTFTATFVELGKAARDGAGWHASLDRLGCEVAGTAPPWSAADRWKQVRMPYIERFGPEASSIGPPVEWEEVHGGPTGDKTADR